MKGKQLELTKFQASTLYASKDIMFEVQNSTPPASSMESCECTESCSSSPPHTGVKTAVEYYLIPSTWAFENLLSTSCIPMSTTESSQTSKDMKRTAIQRLEEYTTQLLNRFHFVISTMLQISPTQLPVDISTLSSAFDLIHWRCRPHQ